MLKSTELIADALQKKKDECDKLEEMAEMMGRDITNKEKKLSKAEARQITSGLKQDQATC